MVRNTPGVEEEAPLTTRAKILGGFITIRAFNVKNRFQLAALRSLYDRIIIDKEVRQRVLGDDVAR